MRSLVLGTVAALALALVWGEAAATEYSPDAAGGPPPVPGASTTTTKQTYTDASGRTVTTTTTTTTYPATGETIPDAARTSAGGTSPRDSQMATGTHCPPGTPDCASSNK